MVNSLENYSDRVDNIVHPVEKNTLPMNSSFLEEIGHLDLDVSSNNQECGFECSERFTQSAEKAAVPLDTSLSVETGYIDLDGNFITVSGGVCALLLVGAGFMLAVGWMCLRAQRLVEALRNL